MSEDSNQYSVRVRWTGGKSGDVDVRGLPTIRTGIPPDQEDLSRLYAPEELFVAAGSVCFMNSFVHFTQKMRIEFKSLEVESVGTLEQVERSFEVTKIHSKATVVISSEDIRKKMERALELGAKYCFISNSMKCPTTHENVILIDEKT
ncbi:MAG: OsmC family protein [Candidatus Thorarchaeota archaeon]